MKKSKWLVLLLVVTLIASLTLTACGGNDEDTSSDAKIEDKTDDSAKDQDEDKKEEDTNKEEEKKEEAKAPEGFTTDTASLSKDILAKEQVLSVNLGEEPPCLDPQVSTDGTSSTILNDTLEGLIRMDHTGEVKKGSGMAIDWTLSDDKTVYTFKLREANWSDGTPVTAHDFEYSWKRIMDPELASDYAFMTYDIKNSEAFYKGEITDPSQIGVKALDDHTLEVTLGKPNPTFLSKLQHSTFFPSRKDMVEELGNKYASEADLVPSNGPFKVAEWKHESKVILEKNPEYWDADSVILDKINFHIIKNSNSVVGMYKTGELDYIGVPQQFIDEYIDELQLIPQAFSVYRTFNNEHKYLKNKKLRNAFARAIDQTKIYETMDKGLSQAAYGWVPTGIAGYDGKTFREIAGKKLFKDVGTGYSKEDLDKLYNEALEELGATTEEISDGLRVMTGQTDSALKYVQIYQQMLESNLGVKVTIEQNTWKVRLDKQASGDFEITTGSGWIGDYNDAMTFMDLMMSDNPQNRARWSNAEYDRLVQSAMDTFDAKKRVDSMIEAEKILIDDMPVHPYEFNVSRLLERPYVKNIVRLPLQVTSGKKWAYILKH
ncbi:peptide ABC transporter substrate-binding protein [Dethiothermospora halolimnae]|uniref:peptide ABC transporter substrate-binding protein n=1 Tax=Dethiothermospora halolimnae TaxID=3114390 RepID=UPI003CCC225E